MLLILVVLAAALVTCGIAIKKEQERKMEVDLMAIESAFSLVDYVKEFNACPKSPSNWQGAHVNESGLLEIQKGYFRLIYKCETDLSATISVFYSFDSESFAHTQRDGSVKWIYGHFTSRNEVVVESPKEILLVLKSI